MKATGIVRRVDDLGRIVIPKENCRERIHPFRGMHECIPYGEGDKYTMKATGIVRRVDDLGRIVIPKENCRERIHPFRGMHERIPQGKL